MDLVNPSAAVGWDGRERMSLQERGPADLGLALALVHHLALANNVPLSMIAEFMRSLFSWLAIEFVPKEDPQAQRLLACREDVFPSYCRSGFEEAFGRQFAIETAVPLCGSARILYLMRRRD